MIKKQIIVGICLILLIASQYPASGSNREHLKTMINNGNILYVGGLGPGNYTTIQEAINDASEGDTVFVFDDSSPYYENIVIDKSITLIGEDPDTTVILGDESSDGVIINISADGVSLNGFTIQPDQGQPAGIVVGKQYTYPDYWNIEIIQNVNIFNNIIRDTGWAGIFTIRLNGGMIYENRIEHSYGSGILLFISSDNMITHNVIVDSAYRGIKIDGLWSPYRVKYNRNPVSENNVISHNLIKSNRWGIALSGGTVNTEISDNIITNNHGMFPGHDGIGIDIYQASKTKVIRNNFIDNSLNAYFTGICVIRYPQYLQNSWDMNYWDEPKNSPVRIDGRYYLVPFPRLPVSISFPNYEFNSHELPWVAFDRHPAQEPFEIG